MRTVMANGCLQLHRAAPCDAVSTRSRPSESLIGTIRGLFNYIWTDNTDPGQINGRKAVGFHRKPVTRRGTSPGLQPALWLPRDTLWREEVLKNVHVGYSVSTDQLPSSSLGLVEQGWRVLSCMGVSTFHKLGPLQALENSASLSLVKQFYSLRTCLHTCHIRRVALAKVNINQILTLGMENRMMIN